MAIIGTTLAVFIALPFGLLAARNTSPHRVVYLATRLLLNMLRAVPEIILALMFVAAVGLCPFSGVLALAFGAVGFMGKLYAEAIEAIDPQQVLAVSATGANRAQTFVYGVLPQALPLVASYSLLLFETNIRSASVLGIVGAGGVGYVLAKYMSLFQYQYLMGTLLLIVLAVTVVDRLSDAIRKRLTYPPVVKGVTAFDRRCISAGCVARPSNMPAYSQSSRLAGGAHRRSRCSPPLSPRAARARRTLASPWSANTSG